MKSLIIYDSIFGNTEKIARRMGEILSTESEAEVIKVSEFEQQKFRNADLLILGSPTRAFKPTPAMGALLRRMRSSDLGMCRTAVFDTRIALEDITVKFIRFFQKRNGGAAGVMKKQLAGKGIFPIADPEGFCVLESEGPLKDGELDRAAFWAITLMRKVQGGIQ